jgi:hypothetical protein
MTPAFVPLLPGSLQTAEASQVLKPLTPASPQFQTAPALEKIEAHKAHAEPKITLERDGDVITHIRVQCGCGQVIELKCSY